MKKEFKELLLKSLKEDPDVISTIKGIITTKSASENENSLREHELMEQIKKLNQSNQYLVQQNSLLEKDAEKWKNELKSKENEWTTVKKIVESDLQKKDQEIETLKDELANCKQKEKEANNQVEVFKMKYLQFEKIYNKYLSLGAPVISRLERILNSTSSASETPELFMAYGIQENNIVALWETIATNFDYYKNQGRIEDLTEIFLYFINLYKEVSFKNIQIEWPNTGDVFDERKHTRTSASSAVGQIQKVILPGFCIGKSIIKKSLVIVK